METGRKGDAASAITDLAAERVKEQREVEEEDEELRGALSSVAFDNFERPARREKWTSTFSLFFFSSIDTDLSRAGMRSPFRRRLPTDHTRCVSSINFIINKC